MDELLNEDSKYDVTREQDIIEKGYWLEIMLKGSGCKIVLHQPYLDTVDLTKNFTGFKRTETLIKAIEWIREQNESKCS